MARQKKKVRKFVMRIGTIYDVAHLIAIFRALNHNERNRIDYKIGPTLFNCELEPYFTVGHNELPATIDFPFILKEGGNYELAKAELKSVLARKLARRKVEFIEA